MYNPAESDQGHPRLRGGQASAALIGVGPRTPPQFRTTDRVDLGEALAHRGAKPLRKRAPRYPLALPDPDHPFEGGVGPFWLAPPDQHPGAIPSPESKWGLCFPYSLILLQVQD